jgi:hypothetical protein
MPGDCMPRREELAKLQESPTFRWDRNLKLQAPSAFSDCATLGSDPGCSAQAFPKSLFYNILLMAGQTRAYEFARLAAADDYPFSSDWTNEKVSHGSGWMTLDCKQMVTCGIVLGRLGRIAKKGHATLKLKSSNRMPFSPNDLYRVRYALEAPAGERNLACP